MKRVLILLVILYSNSCLFGQFGKPKEARDTIFKLDNQILPVDVTQVSSSYVSFVVPGDTGIYTIERKQVHKIVYKNGRIDIFNKPAVVVIDENAWEAVWLTENKKDVVNMYKLARIEAKSSPSSRSPKAAKKGAIIKLKKKAASINGTIILVTHKERTGGYGEFPGYLIKGIAYGTEPPDEEEEEGAN